MCRSSIVSESQLNKDRIKPAVAAGVAMLGIESWATSVTMADTEDGRLPAAS